MSRRIMTKLILVAAVLVCALFTCAGAVYADVPEGMLPEKVNGKYEIYNADQLEVYWTITAGNDFRYNGQTAMSGDKGASCILMDDINYEVSELKPQMQRFSNDNSAYTGTLDGNGKRIYNIPNTFANTTSGNFSGILINYNNGVIKDVEFDFGTIEIKGNAFSTGGLLCNNNLPDGIISGVTMKGNISTNKGGLFIFCYNNKGAIRDCCALGSLTSTGNSSFGLVTIMQDNGVMENVYNGMDMTNTGGKTPYGLIQNAQNNNLRNCFCSGRLMAGETEVTALSESDESLTNCYKSTDTFTAADLGDAFTDDRTDDPINRGYPVLKFQVGGDYPHVESIEDVVVTALKGMSDTYISFATDAVFTYYVPKTTDFKIIATNEDGVSVSVVPSSIIWAKKSKTLIYPSLLEAKSESGDYLAGKTERTIQVKLEAGGREIYTGEITIPASDDWRDYGEEPETVDFTDDRYGEKFTDYYKITTPEELAWFANNYQTGWSAFLTADIDLGGYKWYGIGDKKDGTKVQFTGTFDGNGYIIRNMASYNGEGLINTLGSNSTEGVVKNVCVEDSFVKGENWAGGIVRFLFKGSIINCSFSGEVRTEGGTETYMDNGAAGIVASSQHGNACSVTGCVNYGKITGRQSDRTGGIAGHSGALTIENCYNMGETNGGGILGDANTVNNSTFIRNCYNAGKVGKAITDNQYAVVNDCYSLIGAGKIAGDVSVFTEEEAKDGTLLEYLGTEAYLADEKDMNDGYPVLKWQNTFASDPEWYSEELDYYVDLDEYSTNKAEIQAIIEDAKERLANAQSAAEADAILAEAKASIDAIPNDEQVKQNLDDEIARLEELIDTANKTLAFDMCLISLDKTEFVYDGSAFEPVVTATTKEGAALVKNTDYEVAYEANIDPGVAKVLVTGKGDYAGTRELTFNIAPAANKIISLKKAKKAFTVKWTKDDKATGYQVSYGLKKNFKGAKTVKITKKTTISKKVTKLKAKKKYFVRVRTYVTSGEQTIYGAWSPVKSVKTK